MMAVSVVLMYQFGAVIGIVLHYDNHDLQKENSSVHEDQKAI